MEVRALFFASHRELLGTEQIPVTLPEGSVVSDLVEALRSRGGPFGGLPPDAAIAVNRSYARSDRPLTDGDEVAFIPPVAGG